MYMYKRTSKVHYTLHNICYIIHRYYAFDIGEPEVVYAIHISVQQREYIYNTTTKKEEAVWKTVGEAAVGPKVFGRKITSNKVKESPEVCENVVSPLEL